MQAGNALSSLLSELSSATYPVAAAQTTGCHLELGSRQMVAANCLSSSCSCYANGVRHLILFFSPFMVLDEAIQHF
jgi:hypothetical protein